MFVLSITPRSYLLGEAGEGAPFVVRLSTRHSFNVSYLSASPWKRGGSALSLSIVSPLVTLS